MMCYGNLECAVVKPSIFNCNLSGVFFATGSLHGVQLFPRESCSCSINQRCAHIMAVMLALGMPVTYDKKGSIKMIKPQVITTPSAEYVMESVQPKHDGTNVSSH